MTVAAARKKASCATESACLSERKTPKKAKSGITIRAVAVQCALSFGEAGSLALGLGMSTIMAPQTDGDDRWLTAEARAD